MHIKQPAYIWVKGWNLKSKKFPSYYAELIFPLSKDNNFTLISCISSESFDPLSNNIHPIVNSILSFHEAYIYINVWRIYKPKEHTLINFTIDSGRDGKCMLGYVVRAGFNVNNVSSRHVCLCIFGNETQNWRQLPKRDPSGHQIRHRGRVWRQSFNLLLQMSSKPSVLLRNSV